MVRILRKPGPSIRPSADRKAQWKTISHLSLNHLSMLTQGKETLQEGLALYNYNDSLAMTKQIKGIHSVETQMVNARVSAEGILAFARGTEVTMTFDEDCYGNANLFLFASILERFLGQFCPPQSFVRFRMATLQRGTVVTWPPRMGEAVWL